MLIQHIFKSSVRDASNVNIIECILINNVKCKLTKKNKCNVLPISATVSSYFRFIKGILTLLCIGCCGVKIEGENH